MSKIDLNAKSDQFVFRNVVYHKSKGTYSLGNRKVSYSRLRELFTESLTKLGYDQSLYGLHSFRSGVLLPSFILSKIIPPRRGC